MTRRQRIRRIAAAAAAAAALVAGSITGVYVWPGGSGGAGGGGLGFLLLDLQAPRDFGAIAPRGTGAGQWCGPVEGLAAPAHCWELQQSSGDATDYGAVGGWHLSPQGSPRCGVATGLPVQASPIDWTSELAIHSDTNTDFFREPSVATTGATNLVSVDVVFAADPIAGSHYLVQARGTVGWYVRITGENIVILGDGPGGNLSVVALSVVSRQGWHCLTAVLDGRTTDAAKIYLDGTDVTPASPNLFGNGPWAGTANFDVGNSPVGVSAAVAVARARVTYDATTTLAQHRALCGSWGLPVASSHRTAPDHTWTQSGGSRCYQRSATAATCYPGGAPAARWTATGFEWAVDGQGAVNRVLYSTAVDCTNWTCSTATTAAYVAPDGSKTAASITMGGGYIEQTATGYTVSTAVNLAMWAKCSTGTLDASNVGGAGHWTVDCSAVGGSWALLTPTHPAVLPEVQAWASTGAGAVNLRLSGADAEVWAPTITEEPTTGAVIPTAAAAVDTGTIAWTIDNSTGSYWRTGANVLHTLDTVDGTCLVTGSTLRLSGAGGSECVGGWSALKVWQ